MIGFVKIVNSLNQEFIDTLALQSGVDVKLFVGSSVLSSGLNSLTVSDISASLPILGIGEQNWYGLEVPDETNFTYGARFQVEGEEFVTILMGMSREQLQQAVAALRKSILWALGGFLLLFLPVGLFFTYRAITKPVTDLVSGMASFGKGEWHPLKEKQLAAEFSSMACTFNSMAGAIQQRDAEKRVLTTVVEQSPSAVIITDTEGNIEYVNSNTELLTGYTAEELRGKKPSMFKSGQTPSDKYDQLWQTISKGKVWRGELLNKAKDGTHFWELCVIAPIFAPDGTISKYVALKENITERKHAEKEKVMLEEQLHQAQKMESIGRLTGGVAHDFNNILSAINGYSEMILMRMDNSSPFRNEIEIILQSGQRAARLTQQLLAFSRKQVIKPELLDLTAEVAESRKMLSRLLGEDIEIEIGHVKELWPIKVDRSQLEQVILNLAVNARDAMPLGGKLTIETSNVSLDGVYIKSHYNISPGDYVMLAISDNGKGMDKETREHIFEPFFTTKIKGKGTGLGLATVYGIIKQNNGEIQVYSEPDQGTIFKIYLPRADESLEKTDSHLSVNRVSDIGGTETILLVEDDEMVRNLGIDILSGLGYTVLEAENGEDALQVCARFHGKVDLLLTDVVMPKMSGPDLAARINEQYPQTKVLFMSGYTENAIVRHGVLAENVNYLHKPITPKSLSHAVRKVLG